MITIEEIKQIIKEEVENVLSDYDVDWSTAVEDNLDEKKSSRCTKVTKKTSSTRKGKKWMKCVKSDSGGYKRIHWEIW